MRPRGIGLAAAATAFWQNQGRSSAGVWPDFLAASTCWAQLAFPIAGPLSTLGQSFQGHEGLRIVGVPPHPRAFEPRGERLARRLGRPATDLPSFDAEPG